PRGARLASARREREAREAARAADAAAASFDRLEAQRAALAERRTDLEPLLAVSHESVEAAGSALDALAAPAQLAGEIDCAREAAAVAGQAVAEMRAAAATRAREMCADRERGAGAPHGPGE